MPVSAKVPADPDGLAQQNRLTGRRMAAARMRGVRFPVSLGLTLGAMASANLLSNRVIPNADAAVGVGLVGGLAVVAKASDLGTEDLGLARRTWASGLRWGGVSAAIVAAGYGIAAVIPAVRDFTADSTATLPGTWSRRWW